MPLGSCWGAKSPMFCCRRWNGCRALFVPWSRADPAGSRVGAARDRCGEGPWGSCSPPASVAPPRSCAEDSNSHCDPQRDAKGSPAWVSCVCSDEFFWVHSWGRAGGGFGWVGLCPQTTLRLSRVVPTAPSQAGQGPHSTGGAQGPVRLAGRVPGQPSARRGGAASRCLGPAAAAPADGSRTRCSSGPLASSAGPSQSCPAPTSGAALLPRGAAFAALGHRPGQRRACPRPIAASRPGAASPRSARAEMHFLEAQEAARRGTRLAALPRQMCARGRLNHVCSRHRLGRSCPGAAGAARASPEPAAAPAQDPAPRPGRSTGSTAPAGSSLGQPDTHTGAKARGWVCPAPPPRVAGGHRGQAGQGQNALRAGAGQHWGHAWHVGCARPAEPARGPHCPRRWAPAARTRRPAPAGPARREPQLPAAPAVPREGRWGRGGARPLLGAVVRAPDGEAGPLPGPPGAVGGGGGCARGRRRRGERGHGRGSRGAGPGRQVGSAPGGGTADIEHPARAAAGSSGLCPARRSRGRGGSQGPAQSGRCPGCPTARPGKGRGGPQGRARRRRGVPVSVTGGVGGCPCP